MPVNRLRRLLGGLIVVALMAPALALAVTPRGGHYRQTKGRTIVVEFDVVSGKVQNFFHFDKCVKVPVFVGPVSIKSNGTFSSTQTVKDVLKARWKVTLSGHTVSRTKVAGSVTYKRLSGRTCKTTTAYSAPRTGKAGNGAG